MELELGRPHFREQILGFWPMAENVVERAKH